MPQKNMHRIFNFIVKKEYLIFIYMLVNQIIGQYFLK